jgi:hypothetical protein
MEDKTGGSELGQTGISLIVNLACKAKKRIKPRYHPTILTFKFSGYMILTRN